MRKVAVILVNAPDYAEKHLLECYQSLESQSYPRDLFEIFIVHNGVSRESKRLSEALAPRARFFEHERNEGWAAGNNKALGVALRENFEYFVILNLDTVVDPNWLRALVERADQEPTTHIFQSKILFYGTNQVHSLGNRIHFLGYGYCQGYGAEDSSSISNGRLDFASGASMLVKRDVFERIGLFREEYFLYYDDLEFSWRARLAGFRVGLAPRSICYHKSRFNPEFPFLYDRERNRLLTLFTLERGRTLLLIAPCLLAAQIVTGIYLAAKGYGETEKELVRYFLQRSTWTFILKTRRQIDGIRRRKDCEIVRDFAGAIAFSEIQTAAFRLVVNPFLGLYWSVARRLVFW